MENQNLIVQQTQIILKKHSESLTRYLSSVDLMTLLSSAPPAELAISTMSVQAQLSLTNANSGIQLGTLFNKGTDLEKANGRRLVEMQVCYIISSFNRSLKVNAENKMTGTDVYECATLLMPDMFYYRLEDLILCLRMAKEGKFGPAFNRVDVLSVMEYWQKYQEIKNGFREAEYYAEKGQYGEYRTEEHTRQIKAERISKQKTADQLEKDALRAKLERANFNQVTEKTK